MGSDCYSRSIERDQRPIPALYLAVPVGGAGDGVALGPQSTFGDGTVAGTTIRDRGDLVLAPSIERRLRDDLKAALAERIEALTKTLCQDCGEVEVLWPFHRCPECARG